MARLSDMIAAGWLDRLILRLSSLGTGEIKSGAAGFERVVESLRTEAGYDNRAGYRAWRDLAEAARLAVNAARRFERETGDPQDPRYNPGKTVGPAQAPCAERPSGRCVDRVEYTVIVEGRDPATGGVSRFPVVVSSTTGLTAAQIAALATAAARTEENWRESGARGVIDRSTATISVIQVVSIIGRE